MKVQIDDFVSPTKIIIRLGFQNLIKYSIKYEMDKLYDILIDTLLNNDIDTLIGFIEYFKINNSKCALNNLIENNKLENWFPIENMMELILNNESIFIPFSNDENIKYLLEKIIKNNLNDSFIIFMDKIKYYPIHNLNIFIEDIVYLAIDFNNTIGIRILADRGYFITDDHLLYSALSNLETFKIVKKLVKREYWNILPSKLLIECFNKSLIGKNYKVSRYLIKKYNLVQLLNEETSFIEIFFNTKFDDDLKKILLLLLRSNIKSDLIINSLLNQLEKN